MINPYNFVPLGTSEPSRSPYPRLHRVQAGTYSGVLECKLIAQGPLVTVDHRSSYKYKLKNPDGSPATDRNGQPWDLIKVFFFLRDSAGQPIIQGTSLKGMVRSVYEAMVDACLPFAATDKPGAYSYQDLGKYRGDACNDLEKLCPACRLFGTIEGDKVHCQGRIRFTDAGLTKGSLVKIRRYLRELSSPKPHHHATYGKNGLLGGEIVGRKFYYHHGESPNFSVEEQNSNDRSSAIDEYAPRDAEFSFQVHINNLDPQELGRLLLAFELDEGLGHKLGMGKAIGLGSCRIVVDDTKSHIWQLKDRYGQWAQQRGVTATPPWRTLKPQWDQQVPAELIEILRLNKPNDGEIGYPGLPYLQTSIDARGVFGGRATTGGRPRRALARADVPSGPPPINLRPGDKAAWLKEIWEDGKRILVTEQGQEEREKNDFQGFGKKNPLEAGRWCILRGERSVWPG